MTLQNTFASLHSRLTSMLHNSISRRCYFYNCHMQPSTFQCMTHLSSIHSSITTWKVNILFWFPKSKANIKFKLCLGLIKYLDTKTQVVIGEKLKLLHKLTPKQYPLWFRQCQILTHSVPHKVTCTQTVENCINPQQVPKLKCYNLKNKVITFE